MALATMLLDALQIPYTGAQTDAILATSNKLTAKQRLQSGRIADTGVVRRARRTMISRFPRARQHAETGNARIAWILKPVLEHASFGMDDDAVVRADDLATLAVRLPRPRATDRAAAVRRAIHRRARIQFVVA